MYQKHDPRNSEELLRVHSRSLATLYVALASGLRTWKGVAPRSRTVVARTDAKHDGRVEGCRDRIRTNAVMIEIDDVKAGADGIGVGIWQRPHRAHTHTLVADAVAAANHATI